MASDSELERLSSGDEEGSDEEEFHDELEVRDKRALLRLLPNCSRYSQLGGIE